MGRRGKGPREDLVPPEAKAEGKALPAAARRASVGRGANVGQGARVEGNVARVDRVVRHRVDRRRVDLAVAGAQGWGRPARSGLWRKPCRSTLTATARSTATN